MYDQSRVHRTTELSQVIFEKSLSKIILNRASIFEEQFNRLTQQQKMVLSVLAKNENANLKKIQETLNDHDFKKMMCCSNIFHVFGMQ